MERISSARTPRRPTSARTPRARDASAAAEGEPPVEKPWLFGLDRPLSAADMSRMGFSRAIVLDTELWADEAEAAFAVSDAFRLPEPLPSLHADHRRALMAQICAAFSGCAFGGDLLIVLRAEHLVDLEDGSVESDCCYACIGRVVDAIAGAWEEANALGDPTLAAVIVVLEAFPRRRVQAIWGDPDADAEREAHAVVPLEDDLSNFFEV